MYRKTCSLTVVFGLLGITVFVSNQETIAQTTVAEHSTSGDVIPSLAVWLTKSVDERGQLSEQPFATKTISKSEAVKANEMLWEDHVDRIKKTRTSEWKEKLIKLDKLEMKFDFKVFGERPENGRSLFISMHGGGGAPARVNEQQWKNQVGLYKPAEGVYLAPRAPTDTWNLWHQSHIDEFFTRIIEDAIVFEDVDPNRIYIMGYSAGGDGAYQLAPRMADQLAAAAMMAGHPNDAQPLGLRNIGFTLHMGGKDSAYNRNKIAAQWKEKLTELQKNDDGGYVHEVQIHEQHGHWMKRDDAVAVPWMAKFTRDPLPEKIVWFQSGVTHDRFYWLAVDQENRTGGTHVVAERNGQSVQIEKADKVKKLIIRFNDEMMDLDKDISIGMGENVLFVGKANRTIETIAKTLKDRGDKKSVYSAQVEVVIPAQNEK